MLLGEKMLQEEGIGLQFSCYKDHIKNDQDFRIILTLPFGRSTKTFYRNSKHLYVNQWQ